MRVKDILREAGRRLRRWERRSEVEDERLDHADAHRDQSRPHSMDEDLVLFPPRDGTGGGPSFSP